MLTAVWLAALFLASYPFKLAFLGREALETWGRDFVYVLRFHEACILAMLLSGGLAATLARRLRLAVRFADPHRADPEPATTRGLARGVRLHRRAGWTAVIFASLGVMSAAYVLFGMYQRA